MFTEQLARHPFDVLPEHHREPAREALLGVADADARITLTAVSGGASGALVHRVGFEDGANSLLLRIETSRDPFRNPHRSYVCLRRAADAGIAPAVHAADPDAGIVVMDFIEQRPLDQHPGGPDGLVHELGQLLARLQRTQVFPPLLDDFASVLEQMLAMIEHVGVFAAGVLAPVHDGFATIRAAYPWHLAAQVSSHNDVNPFNVLFDGERLWLIDWEIAFRNDPLADVACVANNFADQIVSGDAATRLETELLTAWLGHAPDRATRARLALMRRLNRLFYACLMLSVSAGARLPEPDLDALSVEAFRAEIEAGRLALGSPHLLHEMGKMQLAGFVAGLAGDDLDEAMREAGST